MRHALLYTKDDCPWCDKAKELLAKRQVSNVALYNVGRDYSPAQFKVLAESYNWTPATVPMIFYRNDANESWVFLGGYDKLEKYFEWLDEETAYELGG